MLGAHETHDIDETQDYLPGWSLKAMQGTMWNCEKLSSSESEGCLTELDLIERWIPNSCE